MAGIEHDSLEYVTLLFCREVWDCPIVGLEPQGPGRFHDVVAMRLGKYSGFNPGIIAFEIKATRNDFLLGIKSKQFSLTKYIHEMWLVYTGDFDISELPKHVGILTPRRIPVCKDHFYSKNENDCIADCDNRKLVHLEIQKRARFNTLDSKNIWKSKNDWAWAISRKGTTDQFNSLGRLYGS